MAPGNGFFRTAMNLTAASVISGAVIAFVYFITEPFAQRQRIIQKDRTMHELVSSASAFIPVAGREGWFEADNGSNRIALIIPSEGKGYGGTIRILTAAGTNGEVIDFKILSHNETPGLGDRAALTNFREQFRGKKAAELEVVKKHDGSRIDAITGATITSRAVTKAVRKGMEELDGYLKKM